MVSERQSYALKHNSSSLLPGKPQVFGAHGVTVTCPCEAYADFRRSPVVWTLSINNLGAEIYGR